MKTELTHSGQLCDRDGEEVWLQNAGLCPGGLWDFIERPQDACRDEAETLE